MDTKTKVGGGLAGLIALILAFFAIKPSPTPPPVTPPPVVVDSPALPPADTVKPTPPGPTGIVVMADSFIQYRSTAELQLNISTTAGGKGGANALYKDGYNAALAEIDPSVTYRGHQTLKYNQPSGVPTTPALWAYFPNNAKLKVLWFRAKIRFSPGFTTHGTLASQADAYKLLGWGYDTYDGSGRLEVTNGTQYVFYWTAITKSGSQNVGGGEISDGQIADEWKDGAWYDYIIECDFSKAATVSRAWIAKDGEKPVLRMTLSATMSGSNPLPSITNVALGLNFNDTRTQAQALWYGMWEVVDGVANPDPWHLL